MPTSSKPGPDDRGALSRWEQQILAGIEDDPAAIDPALEMIHRESGPALEWRPLSARSTGTLLVVVSVLMLAGPLPPASWWAVVGLITTLVVVRWPLLAAHEKNQPD
jgi:hypothetical protein